MSRIEREIQIAAEASDVFRFCHNMDLRSEWDERITGVQVLTPKPIRRGSVVRFDTRLGAGPVFSWEGTFVDFSFPSGSTLEVIDAAPSSPFAKGREAWAFKRSRDGVLFSLLWEYEPRGILGRLMDLAARRRTMRSAIVKSLEHLKRMIEAQT